jgi:hypothetical protein
MGFDGTGLRCSGAQDTEHLLPRCLSDGLSLCLFWLSGNQRQFFRGCKMLWLATKHEYRLLHFASFASAFPFTALASLEMFGRLCPAVESL